MTWDPIQSTKQDIAFLELYTPLFIINLLSGPGFAKLFFMLNSTENEIYHTHINVKIPTIVLHVNIYKHGKFKL